MRIIYLSSIAEADKFCTFVKLLGKQALMKIHVLILVSIISIPNFHLFHLSCFFNSTFMNVSA